MHTPQMDIARLLPKRKSGVNYADTVKLFMEAFRSDNRAEMERLNDVLRTLDDKVLTNKFDVVQRVQFIMTGEV